MGTLSYQSFKRPVFVPFLGTMWSLTILVVIVALCNGTLAAPMGDEAQGESPLKGSGQIANHTSTGGVGRPDFSSSILQRSAARWRLLTELEGKSGQIRNFS